MSLRCRPIAACIACVLAAMLAGCGSGTRSATTTTTYRMLSPPTTRTIPTRIGSPPRGIGATQRVSAGRTTLSVTIQRLLDPLTGSGAALLPHTRAAGVVAVIRNDGPGVYDSSSTGDFSIIPTSGTATPVFARAGACQTGLRDWDNEISPGEQRSGCVAFAVGATAKVAQVRFSPHAHAANRATWGVGR